MRHYIGGSQLVIAEFGLTDFEADRLAREPHELEGLVRRNLWSSQVHHRFRQASAQALQTT